nr:winged helix DNA-binding protein [Thermoleophilaceae bacterium]
ELRTVRRRLGWSKANATEVTLTLQGRGMVTRAVDASDRRARVLSITPEGQALVERVFPGHASRVSAAFADLDDEEKRVLTQVCRKLAA